ncbi:ECF transporter S component [Natronospora cellulosivora (SeqCode)]
MNKLLNDPRSLSILAIMLALTVILALTPLGFIPLIIVNATIIHIPTIITAIILGPIAGLFMGTIMGLLSLLNAVTRPTGLLSPLFINPLVSVLPRMFIGVVAYYTYVGMKKLIRKEKYQESISAIVSGVIGSLTNTALVFLMLYVVYAKEITEMIAENLGISLRAFYISVFTTNAIAEAVVAAFVTGAIVLAYKNYNKIK